MNSGPGRPFTADDAWAWNGGTHVSAHDVLGAHLKPHGLRFGPETATSNRANIGGMIGNNSAEARSLIYGKNSSGIGLSARSESQVAWVLHHRAPSWKRWIKLMPRPVSPPSVVHS